MKKIAKAIVKDHRFWWIVLGGLAILVKQLSASYPLFIEQYYSTSFFHVIRWLLDHTFGFVPFAFLYILILVSLIFLLKGTFVLLNGKAPLTARIRNSFVNLLATIGGILFFFQLFWGFNYNRVPLETHLGLQSRALEKEELQQELSYSLSLALSYRARIAPEETIDWEEKINLQELKIPVRRSVERMLESIDYPDSGNPQLRFLYPKGSLLVWNTAGFYNPLTGECQVDPGLHPLQIPFVMAHEYNHAYGFADEGSCNFLAWLAGTQADEPLLQYSAHLNYWRYLASAFRRGWKEDYTAYRQTLPDYFVSDLRAIDEYSDRYPELFPELRYKAYDTYLKSQGVKEGMKSYSRMVLLCSAWRRMKEKEAIQ